MNNLAVISVSVAPIHRCSDFSSEMVTQGLLFDYVKIIETKNKWHKIQTHDAYIGWIHGFYLSDFNLEKNEGIHILERIMPIFSNPNDISSLLMILSFATYVNIIDEQEDFLKIQLPNGRYAFMKYQYKVFDKNRKNLINFAKRLLGVPYLWGGISSFGYDCSGFVQAVLKVFGLSLKRDAAEQIEHEGLYEIDMLEGQPGDLIFFSENNKINHVAFLIGVGKIIHCSGQVKIESIIDGCEEFNRELFQYDKRVMSINNILK